MVMNAYRIDLQHPSLQPISCQFVPSLTTPGKMLCINEDGSALVVLPDGTERPHAEPPGPNWDSPWTQATVFGSLLVYYSDGGPHFQSVARAYRMVR